MFGAFILCVETFFHFDSIVNPSSWTDLPIHDWIAGAGLVTAGAIGRFDHTKGQASRAAAWGFMSSLLMAAFVGHVEEWNMQTASDGWMSGRLFLVCLALPVVASVLGLVGTLAKRR